MIGYMYITRGITILSEFLIHSKYIFLPSRPRIYTVVKVDKLSFTKIFTEAVNLINPTIVEISYQDFYCFPLNLFGTQAC